jgi:hypothetical protein
VLLRVLSGRLHIAMHHQLRLDPHFLDHCLSPLSAEIVIDLRLPFVAQSERLKHDERIGSPKWDRV